MKPSTSTGNKQALLKKMLAQTRRIREEAEAKGQQYEKIDWFIPAKGDNSIRVLPSTKGGDHPFFRQVSTHFLPIKKKNGEYAKIPVRCLTDFEETCPMCKAFAKKVKSTNAKTKEEANWLRPSTKFLVNVINYAERKVQPYAMASTVFNSITGWMEEFQSPIYDLEEGYDFKVIKKVKAGKTEYEVRPSVKPSAVPDKLKVLVDSCVDLETLYKDNEKKRMLEFLGEAADEDEEETEEETEDTDTDDADEDEDDAPKGKKKSKPAEDEEEEDESEEEEDEDSEEEEDEDDGEEESEDDDDSEEEEDDDADEEEEDDESPKAKALKAKAKLAAKSKSASSTKGSKKPLKKKSTDDDEEDFGVDIDDEDLDKEFEDLDV